MNFKPDGHFLILIFKFLYFLAQLIGIQKVLSTRFSLLISLERKLLHQYNLIILYQEFLLWKMKSCITWLSKMQTLKFFI